METSKRQVDVKKLIYYADLICKKIDFHTDATVERIEALRQGNLEKVEFIEKMILEPLDNQIAYLTEKASSLKKEKLDE